jgi:hypothetical protein
MKFQSTDWIAQFACNAADHGKVPFIASDDYDASTKVVGKVQSLFQHHRGQQLFTKVVKIGEYDGYLIWKGSQNNPNGPDVRMIFDSDGQIEFFGMGPTFAVYEGKKQPKWVSRALLQSIESGDADNAYNLFHRAVEEMF